jgi:hypothetical protein
MDLELIWFGVPLNPILGDIKHLDGVIFGGDIGE